MRFRALSAIRAARVVLVGVLLTACDRPITDPRVDNPKLLLAADTVTLSAIGETVTIGVTRAGRPVEAQFTLATEWRHLSELPVLRPELLAARQIVATGPGSAVVIVSAARSLPDTLLVRVRPAKPLLVSWRASSAELTDQDSVLMRGYALDDLSADSILLDGAPARRIRSDSANLILAVPPARHASCSNARVELIVRGLGSPVTANFSRGLPQSVTLSVSDVTSLSSSEVGCLLLAAQDRPVRYLLAHAHAEPWEKSRTQALYYVPADSYTVEVEDLDAPGVVSHVRELRGRLDLARPRESDVVFETVRARESWSSASVSLAERTVPWQVGDEATFQSLVSPRTITARVVKLYGAGAFVVMVPTDEISQYGSVESAYDSAMTWIADRMVPVYVRALGPEPESTSPLVKQLVIVITPHGFASGGAGALAGAWIELYAPGGGQAANAVELLAHELTHSWHVGWRHGMDGTTPYGAWEQWNVEGLAEYFATDALRRWYGHSFEDNIPPRQPYEPAGYYYWKTYQIDGRYLANGYAPAAALLRNITWNLMRERSMSYDDAFAAVAQGAAAGWYGCSVADCRAEGLAERMSRELGPTWDPADAILIGH